VSGGRAAETDSDQSLETAGGAKAAPGAKAVSAKAAAAARGAADAARGHAPRHAPPSSDAAKQPKESRSTWAVPAGREGKPGKPGLRCAASTVAVAQRMQAATRDKALERMQVRADAKLAAPAPGLTMAL
jgi:hypothetical protein